MLDAVSIMSPQSAQTCETKPNYFDLLKSRVVSLVQHGDMCLKLDTKHLRPQQNVKPQLCSQMTVDMEVLDVGRPQKQEPPWMINSMVESRVTGAGFHPGCYKRLHPSSSQRSYTGEFNHWCRLLSGSNRSAGCLTWYHHKSRTSNSRSLFRDKERWFTDTWWFF